MALVLHCRAGSPEDPLWRVMVSSSTLPGHCFLDNIICQHILTALKNCWSNSNVKSKLIVAGIRLNFVSPNPSLLLYWCTSQAESSQVISHSCVYCKVIIFSDRHKMVELLRSFVNDFHKYHEQISSCQLYYLLIDSFRVAFFYVLIFSNCCLMPLEHFWVFSGL